MTATKTTTNFTIECEKIENITAHRGVIGIEIKEGYIWPHHEKDVIKCFPDSVLIEEIFRRHPNSSVILNKL